MHGSFREKKNRGQRYENCLFHLGHGSGYLFDSDAADDDFPEENTVPLFAGFLVLYPVCHLECDDDSGGVLRNGRFPLCNCSNGDCCGVGMERAAIDCGGSGSLWNGTACLTHRTVDIEQSSTHSERTGALACSDDFMQRAISPLQLLQR